MCHDAKGLPATKWHCLKVCLVYYILFIHLFDWFFIYIRVIHNHTCRGHCVSLYNFVDKSLTYKPLYMNKATILTLFKVNYQKMCNLRAFKKQICTVYQIKQSVNICHLFLEIQRKHLSDVKSLTAHTADMLETRSQPEWFWNTYHMNAFS